MGYSYVDYIVIERWDDGLFCVGKTASGTELYCRNAYEFCPELLDNIDNDKDLGVIGTWNVNQLSSRFYC
jgi:hypothetical protein